MQGLNLILTKMKKRDLKRLNAILDKICNENNIERSNVTVDKDFGYVITEDFNKKDADFCTTLFDGITYKVQYVSGCFNPYILELKPLHIAGA